MADLILDARIASLEASLLKVQDLLGWATRRQQCLDKMNKLLQDSRNDLRRSCRFIDRYVHPQKMDAQERGSVPDDLASAAQAIEDLNRLTGQLESGQKELVPLSKFSAQISGRGAAREIQSQFKKNAMDLLGSLQHLDRADPQVWQKYEKDVRASAQGLFAAFSEFLAGLALRDSGFDEDICEIAEELLKCFAISQASSTDLLTIPIPHEIMAISLVEILRAVIQLSYPEWTLWSLPIVAHEFWRAFASQQPDVRKWFEGDPERQGAPLDVDDPQLCLADAFGACSMGPAYAYYAFLLSLNPVNAFADSATGEPAASKRALAIVSMLGSTNNQRNVNPWSGVIDDLRNSWDEAVAAANPGAIGLSQDIRDKITRAVSRLAKALGDTQVPFGAANWERAANWASDLEKEKVDVDKIPVDPSDRMRDVLNAAWLARKGVSEVNRIAKIADAAAALRKRIPTLQKQVQSDFPEAA